jgi:hypothetical protein
MMRAWTLPMLLVLSGTAVAAGQIFKGSPGTAAALLLAFLALASVNSPLIFPRSIGAQEAQRRSTVDGRPVVHDCASGWAAAPASCTGSTYGATRQEPQR